MHREIRLKENGVEVVTYCMDRNEQFGSYIEDDVAKFLDIVEQKKQLIFDFKRLEKTMRDLIYQRPFDWKTELKRAYSENVPFLPRVK